MNYFKKRGPGCAIQGEPQMRQNKSFIVNLAAGFALLATLGTTLQAGAAEVAKPAVKKATPVNMSGPVSIAKQGYFYVNGQYTTTKDGQIMVARCSCSSRFPRRARKNIRSS